MPAASPSWIERLVTPLTVTLAVCAVWAVWTAGEVRREPVGVLIHVGQRFLDQGEGASATIDRHHVTAGEPTGYDGQFFYYMALDPRRSPAYMDEPTYRYSRVVYPFLVRAVSVGRPAAIPWALLFVNLAAVAGGTYALALLLRRRGASPSTQALRGLTPGLYIAVTHDLSEPLAYALVLAGLVAWWWDDRPRLWQAGVLLGLAGLTRETTLLFPVALAVAAALGLADGTERRSGRDLRSALVLAASRSSRTPRCGSSCSPGSDPRAPPRRPFASPCFPSAASSPTGRSIAAPRAALGRRPAAFSPSASSPGSRGGLGPTLLALVLNVVFLSSSCRRPRTTRSSARPGSRWG